MAKGLVALPAHLVFGLPALVRPDERLHPGRMPFRLVGRGQVAHLPHHRGHHWQEPERALLARVARHLKLDQRLIGDVEEAGDVGLVLEHGDQLREILEAIQVFRREVVKEPALERLEIDLIEQIVGGELLRRRIIAGLRIVPRRQQPLHQRVDGRLVAFGLAALDEDHVILLGVELLRVGAVQPPVLAVAADQIVAVGLELEVADRVEARHGRQHDAGEQDQPGVAANGIGQDS